MHTKFEPPAKLYDPLRKGIDKAYLSISDIQDTILTIDTGIGLIEYQQPDNLINQQIMECIEKIIKKNGAKYLMDRLNATVKQLEV